MCPSMCQQQLLFLPKIWFDEKLLCFIAYSLGLKLNEVFNSEKYLFSEAMPLSEAVADSLFISFTKVYTLLSQWNIVYLL